MRGEGALSGCREGLIDDEGQNYLFFKEDGMCRETRLAPWKDGLEEACVWDVW